MRASPAGASTTRPTRTRQTMPFPLLSHAALALVLCSAPVGVLATNASSASTTDVATVREALDRGDLEAALGELSRLVAERRLSAAREARAAGENERALELYDRTLELARGHREARAERAELCQVVAAELLERARTALDRGRPEDALLALDRVLELEPGSADALLLRGRGFWDLGTKAQQAAYYEDSLASYREASARDARDARAWFGASRAARTLMRSDDALAFARRGLDLVGRDLRTDELRIAAEAAFDAFLASRAQQPASDDTRALFLETEDRLEGWIARARPGDAWGWRQLANLYQGVGASSEARARVARGIELGADSPEMSDSYTELVRAEGGRGAVIAEFERLTTERPQLAWAHLALARERFEQAIESLGPDAPNDVAGFLAAERGFARARELDEATGSSALGWEAVARLGRGWANYHQGDDEAAMRAFLSMEELFPGGLEWSYGTLPAGTQSLEFVAVRCYAAQQDSTLARSERAQRMSKAAEIYDTLHAYRPENVNWANNAGFMNRDVAEMLEMSARERARAAGPDTNGDEWKLAERELARAQELMERSWLAYQAAAALAPEDVRVQNDTGLIQTYYLQNDLDAAEAYLDRAVELGEARFQLVADGELALEADALYELENALGDAYQNLGVLHLRLRDDPKTALDWFEKAVAIGPDPRALVKDTYLPGCAQALGTGRNPFRISDSDRWSAPLSARTAPSAVR